MKGGTERAEDYAALCGKQNESHQLLQCCSIVVVLVIRCPTLLQDIATI